MADGPETRFPGRLTVVGPAVSSSERAHVVTDTTDYTPPRVVARSGPAIRAALLAHAPERCAQFEADFRSALAKAAEDLDLSGPQEVLAHWHAFVIMDANHPLTDGERELIARMKAGDDTGWLTQDEHGNWIRL